MKPSSRSDKVRYAIRDIAAEARLLELEGKEIIHLNIGDPCEYDFDPPARIREAAKEALSQKYASYAPSGGDEELRELVAKMEGVTTEDVFVTTGLSEGIDFAMNILLDPGDEMLLPNPVYPLYSSKAEMLDAKPVFYDCDENWVPILEDIRKRITGKTRGIVLISPNNPTGEIWPEKTVKGICDIASEHKLPVFADEVYDQVVFEGSYTNARKVRGDAVVMGGNSISKNYSYPGARVGYVAFHGDTEKKLTDAFLRMCNQRLSVNWEMQRAAIAAFSAPADPAYIEKLKKRRDLLYKLIGETEGLSSPKPNSAMYAMVKVEGYPGNDWEFARQLMREAGVLVAPGSAFLKGKEGVYFRTTFLPTEEKLQQAYENIGKFLKSKA